MHGLHEGAEEVDAGVADAVVLAPQGLHHLLAHDVAHAGGRGQEGRGVRRGEGSGSRR